VAILRSIAIRLRPSEQFLNLLRLWYTRGLENSMGQTESRSMISAYGQLIIRLFCSLRSADSRLCESNLLLDRISGINNVLTSRNWCVISHARVSTTHNIPTGLSPVVVRTPTPLSESPSVNKQPPDKFQSRAIIRRGV